MQRHYFSLPSDFFAPFRTAKGLLLLLTYTLSISLHAQQSKRDFAPGSTEEKDFHTATRRQDLMMDSLKELITMGQESMNDVMMQTAMGIAFQNIEPVMKTDYPAYVRSNPASGANLRLISDLMNCKPVAGWMDTLDVLYRSLPTTSRNSQEGKILGDQLTSELKTAIGHKAMDFTEYDAQGKAISLSSFRGKYVLLDFWASYDKNCDRALPVLNKVHDTYGSKGLVILGVSLDSSKTAWLDILKETNSIMTTQVSDLKGKENAAALLYDVKDLPKNFLIDPNGIIIAKGLTSITLDQTLSAIFE